MSHKAINCIAVSFVALWSVALLHAQPDFQRTKVVDPDATDFANFNDIQAAIDDIGEPGANDHWTVLIYPGVYTIDGTTHELIELGANDERISLVGVDRQSVIIKVTTTGSGIKITSGTETSRDCRIANLTIQTTNGHGIEIVKGGTPVPKNITIEGVTIDAAGTDKHGISAPEVEELRVPNCKITTTDGHGIELVKPTQGTAPKNITIEGLTIAADGSGNMGIRLKSAEDVVIDSSSISSNDMDGLRMDEDCQNVTVRGCDIRGGRSGVYILLGDHVLFDGCHIVADNSQSGVASIYGLFYDRMSATPDPHDPTDIVAIGCRIEAVNVGEDAQVTYKSVGVQTDTDTFPRVVNCQIVATAKKNAVYGVYGGGGNNLDPCVVVIGGSISTHCDDEKETEVWDLRRDDPLGQGTGSVLVSGARLSKWRGPIKSAERPRSVVQRTINVASSSASAILTATALTQDEQPDVTPTGQPDVYRVLSVTGNLEGMVQDVYIVGSDWAENDITDKIRLTGTTAAEGLKPFKTVTKIILPARSDIGQQVSVGTTSKLGLYYPLSATGDVIQWGKKASAEDSYTIQNLTGDHGLNIDEIYATVEPKDGITADDSFEWAVLASQ